MSNFVEVIKACESASGAGTKDAIKAALLKADATAQKLIHYAMDPYRVYGIRKYDMPTAFAGSDQSEYASNYEFLFALLDDLAVRAITGNAAREAVTKVLGLFHPLESQYIARIFDKDLKAGFSADTFNKIHKTNKIPTFEVMLADKCDSTEDFEKEVTFPCQGDFKYDGERTIAVVKDASVTYYSRSGKEAVHVNGLFDEELRRIHDVYGDFVLDGERYASNFTETMNAKKSGNDEAKKNLKFRAFFIMPLQHWLEQKTDITMKKNREFLTKLLDETFVKIVLSEGREVVDYQDMMEYCNEAIDVHKVEGLILKDWNATYQWDRTFAWTKVKRFYDADCRIVGFYPGRPKSRLEKTLGGISVVGFLEDGTRVECNVGSGFSDELRSEIWNNQQSWLGRTVVIKYQEVSKAKGKEHASLRFPTYERDRDDKIVEI